jgi:hypothetical protein
VPLWALAAASAEMRGKMAETLITRPRTISTTPRTAKWRITAAEDQPAAAPSPVLLYGL